MLRLQPALLSVILGLVLLTTLAIGSSAAYLAYAGATALLLQARNTAVTAASGQLEQFFTAGPRITAELEAEARRGALPLAPRSQLVAVFAERLRAHPQLAWIGYGDATSGTYAGATRYGTDEIVEYLADPTINGGRPDQSAVAADGKRSTPSVVETEAYDVRKKDWFQQGLKQAGPTWTAPYVFTSGTPGITVLNRLLPGPGKPSQGVFHADLRLESIAVFLSGLGVGNRGAVFLLDRDGKEVAGPAGAHVPAARAGLEGAMAQSGGLNASGAPLEVSTGDRNYEVVRRSVEVPGDLGLSIAVVIDRDEVIEGVYAHALWAAGIGLLTALFAVLVGIAVSRRISGPVVAIARDLALVGEFQLSGRTPEASFIREIADLGASAERMKASLRSFGHYVPKELVRSLLAAGRDAELGGERRLLSLHFSDVADFTAMSEGMSPEALVEAMGRYFELMTDTITSQGGTVDKFMGDGILAFFNAPDDVADHPAKACAAALDAQERLARAATLATAAGTPVFRARIGLGLGEVLVGNIGTRERFAYTVLGDEVNLASRLESLNKIYGTSIMASEAMREATGDLFEWRRLDRVAVKGRQQGTLICELMGRRGTVAAERLEARDLYEAGLALYFDRRFAEATRVFQQALALRPGDRAAMALAGRTERYAAAPPETGWSGIEIMKAK